MQSKRSGSSRAGGVGTTLSLVLLATMLTAAAAWFSFQELQPDIERDLTVRVASALQGSNANQFSIDGQDVILAGAVGSEAVSKRMQESAQSVRGVSRVFNNLIIDTNLPAEAVVTAPVENEAAEEVVVVEEVTVVNESEENTITTEEETPLVIADNKTVAAPPSLTITSRDGKVTAQGIVADAGTIERITTVLTGKFGSNNVKDELSSFEGSTSPEWLGGMLSMIDQLDGIEDPIIKVTGSDLILGGTVKADQIRRVKVATAGRLLGADLNVIDNLTVQIPRPELEAAPQAVAEIEDKAEDVTDADARQPEETLVADSEIEATVANEEPEAKAAIAAATPAAIRIPATPASIEIKSTNNQLSLTGFVGTESDASALREGLNNLFGPDSYDDELTVVDSTESPAWINDVLIVTSEIRDVPDFSINIRGGQMSLSGDVEDRETARDLAIEATEIAGENLGVLNNFSVTAVKLEDSEEDLMGLSLLQELEALPTKDILFTKNSTTLTETAAEVLDDVAAAILGYNDLVVEIAGHTDSSGDAVTNLRLSKERAAAVRDYLVERNVPASRLSPIGYGETAPVNDNDTANGRAANRRIEFNL